MTRPNALPRIVYLDRLAHAEGKRLLGEADWVEAVCLQKAADPEANFREFAGAHGYQIMSARDELPAPYFADAALLSRSPGLLVVSTDGAGYDTVDVDACTSAGVLVVNQSGANGQAVAEHALGMLLGLSKRIVEADRRSRRERIFERGEAIGHELYAGTLGVIGLGNCGRRLARMARAALDMTVLAYDPYLIPNDFAERGAESVSLPDLLARSDAVSVHCPRNAETAGMLGADAFAAMKPGAFFVTTARGGIHDEASLYGALASGQIGGAGLDVWDVEPPQLDNRLFTLPNVIVTPHTAGVTHESRHRAATWMVEQWRTILSGGRPPRLINPPAWPRYAERFEMAFGFSPQG